MKEANDNGINVVEELSDSTFKTDEDAARYVLSSVIGEDDDPDIMVVKDGQTVFLKNKKTGVGALALFD